MRSFKEIKKHYDFSEEDETRLRSVSGVMSEHVDEVMDALEAWILGMRETARFFSDEGRRVRVFGAHKRWFLDLFGGAYDHQYYERLIRIGQVHVRADVEAHYMNRAVNIIRNSCIEILSRGYDDLNDRTLILVSLEKILDISLDVITSSYIEEEMRTYSKAYRVKNAMITFTEGFSQTMNFVLILALIGLTLGVVWLFLHDIRELVVSSNRASAIITTLGSMLILWIMIELMNTEISHLKGGKFHISVFVGVALVAFIRETMIATLKDEAPEKIYYLIAAIFVTGIIYWLVTKAEEKGR